MGKIIKLKDVSELIKPNTSAPVGGSFDLSHVGHLRYLKCCSRFGKPLVVIVQSDKTVGYRKGFNRPIINEKRRAEIISHLNFVNYVLILDKPSHYDKYLEIIRPKTFIFSKEDMDYKINRKKLIKEKFPNISVVFFPKNVIRSSTSYIIYRLY
ncbi:adenylyltransferase/cytidyltransferase family protein [Candidatus Pacearchaeota archaeon]|nr:adenylyltransferase/cytidyltransferase family protein [Candidatus Pacearchaeota archaeon]